MAYYSNGTNVANLAGAFGIANAGISSLFWGMNMMTTLDLPNEGFSDGAKSPVTGYQWNGAVIYYINVSLINSLKKNINIVTNLHMTASSGTVLSFSNTLTYPKIYFVAYQAEGGDGDEGGGGGSGFYDLHKIILLPGSSFSVTHASYFAQFKLPGGSAYVNGTLQGSGYSFLINPARGEDATNTDPGVGFRNGGYNELPGESAPQLAEGGGIAANALRHDGYACPAYAIYGGQGGNARALSAGFPASVVPFIGGRGGGGASAARYLANSAAERTGGGGEMMGSYYGQRINAEDGSFGGGGGGTRATYYGGRGGDAYTIVFY